jgi:hypothetical protein
MLKGGCGLCGEPVFGRDWGNQNLNKLFQPNKFSHNVLFYKTMNLILFCEIIFRD